jgi:hypothetical protein
MRRRVWWQIILMDAKYAIFSGMGQSLLPRGWDTKQPKNVHDADLYPSATEPVVDREGPTEMVFCIIAYKAARFLVEYPGFEAMMLMHHLGRMNDPNAPGAAQAEHFKQTLRLLTADLLDAIERYSDPSAGPLHAMAIGFKDHVVEKFNVIIDPLYAQQQWGDEALSAQDSAFKVTVDATETNNKHHEESKDNGFEWFTLMHFQPDLFIYMCAQLCLRTEGQAVERAWVQVQKTFDHHPELFDTTVRSYSLLAQYLLKAWKRREQVLVARSGGRLPEVPDYIAKLRRVMPQEPESRHDSSASDASPMELVSGGGGGGSSSSSDNNNYHKNNHSNYNDAMGLTTSGPAAGGGSGVPPPPMMVKSPPRMVPGVPAGPEVAVDALFGGYLDMGALDWEMWSNMNPTAATGNPAQAFGNFGMGPGAEW